MENRVRGVSVGNVGSYLVVETDFGVIVKYDGDDHLEITLPQSYFSKVRFTVQTYWYSFKTIAYLFIFIFFVLMFCYCIFLHSCIITHIIFFLFFLFKPISLCCKGELTENDPARGIHPANRIKWLEVLEYHIIYLFSIVAVSMSGIFSTGLIVISVSTSSFQRQ